MTPERGRTGSVALVGPWPPYRGGIARFTAELGRSLEARGHRVEGLSFARQYPKLLFPGETQVEASEEDSRPGDHVPRLIDSVDPRSWWKAAAYLRASRPDAVVFQYWMPFFAPAYGTMARWLRRRSRGEIRRLAVVHNALPHERRPGDVVLSRYFFRSCESLIALSSSVRADLERLVPQVPIIEGAHPVYRSEAAVVDREEARRRLGLPTDIPVLLFFGFVRRYKGLDVLLDALPAIRARHPRALLVVAGEFYDDAAPYRDQVRRLGLAGQVRFENRYVPESEVPIFFGAADVVVQPYRSATQSGVAHLAFGFSVPVITTAVGGLAEAVPHGVAGLVVPPESPTRLAEAVCRFLDDDALAATLRAGAARLRDESGWDELARTVETLISSPSGAR